VLVRESAAWGRCLVRDFIFILIAQADVPLGWWYTVESTTTKHLQKQFKAAIQAALASKTEERALMRAKSAKQRFPVAKWVEDLNILQSTAIRIHNEEKSGRKGGRSSSGNRISRAISPALGIRISAHNDVATQADAIVGPGLNRTYSLGVKTGPGHRSKRMIRIGAPVHEVDDLNEDEWNSTEEYHISREHAEQIMRDGERYETLRVLTTTRDSQNAIGLGLQQPYAIHSEERGRRGRSLSPAMPQIRTSLSPDERNRSASPSAGDRLIQRRSRRRTRPTSSVLDLSTVKGVGADFELQHIDPTFSDTTGEYFNAFQRMLESLDGQNSETDLCIEEYLVNSEKAWFKKFREAKLGRNRHLSGTYDALPVPSREASPSLSSTNVRGHRRSRSYPDSERYSSDNESDMSVFGVPEANDEFLLGENYRRPTFVKRVMQRRIGDWPIYSLILALGQIMAANSYQITLLTGTQGQASRKLYVVGVIYMAMSCVWWLTYRRFKSLYVLSIPFAIYGFAFMILGFAPFADIGSGRDTLRNIATGMYTAASASGSMFFGLNFGDEGHYSYHKN
jgi:alpha-1,3-glucan synthase